MLAHKSRDERGSVSVSFPSDSLICVLIYVLQDMDTLGSVMTIYHVLTKVLMKLNVFQRITPCRWVCRYQYFDGTSCYYLQGIPLVPTGCSKLRKVTAHKGGNIQ